MPDYYAPGVYHEELAVSRRIEGVPTALTGFVGSAPSGPVHEPVPLASWQDYVTAFGDLAPGYGLGHAVRDFFDNGGREAVVVRATDLSQALAALPDVNLLVLPPGPRGAADAASVGTAYEWCEAHRAFLVVDGPASWTSAQDAAAADLPAAVGRLGPNAALYFPHLVRADPLGEGRPGVFAAAGAIAGVFARNDAQRGVWKAPAGAELDLRGVSGLAVELGTAEFELLNPVAINGLRRLPGRPPIIWGARTASQSPEWKYVPVRRLALYVEASVERGTDWAAGEPATPATWAQVRQLCEDFLHDLFRRGAFPGQRPQEAYVVRCGLGSTMTEADVQAGRLVIEVGLAPVRPAEFLWLRVQHAAGAPASSAEQPSGPPEPSPAQAPGSAGSAAPPDGSPNSPRSWWSALWSRILGWD